MPPELPDHSLTVLVIGNGGREHALAWKLSHDKSVRQVFVFPGNPGTQNIEAKDNAVAVSNITQKISDYRELAQFAKELDVGLAVVGCPVSNTANGIEEYFREVGIPCFTPPQKAVELEGSRVFAKSFMRKYGIPTAYYSSFDNLEAATSYVHLMFKDNDHRIAITPDGPTANERVLLPGTKKQALEDLGRIMSDAEFSTAGNSVIIEEYLLGYEISILTFSDGKTFFSLPAGQSHKRLLENNIGPNTGGMGVYSPVPMVTPEVLRRINDNILKPTFDAIKKEGLPFQGLLCTTVMVDSSPKVIEYNVGFGDAETQSSMLLMHEDTDLASILLSCTNGTLEQTKDTIELKPGFACSIVIVSGGYPHTYDTGKNVTLKSPPEGVVIFHDQTRSDEKDGSLKTAGGRVFSVAAYADTLHEARFKAYSGASCVSFENMVYRSDIAIGGFDVQGDNVPSDHPVVQKYRGA